MQRLSDITVHPLDLSGHGVVGKRPKYRIVWADSRVDKVIHAGKRYELPRYEFAEGKWIIEKYQTAFELTKMDRAQWEEMLAGPMFGMAQMEYPEEGDYELCYAFAGEVDAHDAHSKVAMLEFGFVNFTDRERTQAIKDKAARDQVEADKGMTRVLENALGRES